MSKFLLLGAATLATAHFELLHPEWRADSLSTDTMDMDMSNMTDHSSHEMTSELDQYLYPCAGASTTDSSPRTEWPLTGGSLKINSHHPWTYMFVNLGLGSDVSDFNYTLTPEMYNITGSGELCITELVWPEGLEVADGDEASLQVVTVGDGGTALYNVSFLMRLCLGRMANDDGGSVRILCLARMQRFGPRTSVRCRRTSP